MNHKRKLNFSIEPGDGTGCSLADAIVRNNNGICSMLNCGKLILPDAKSFYVLKMCPEHETLHIELLEGKNES